MTIDRDTLLFFDASCLIASAGSSSGGSAFLLSLCSRGFLKAAVSQPVLLETERNVLANLGSDAVSRYYRKVATTPMTIVPVPPPNQAQQYQHLVTEKDVHVVAAASASGTAYLITLDKGLLKQVNNANLSLKAYSPGDFIKLLLPQHSDYPTMR